MAEAELEHDAGAEAGEVEAWIVQTQSTLGQLISKPRLLPERLRKPPFRFLFDIAVEVARVTGFGLAEIFGGELAEKPQMPKEKEDKVAFLERWIAAVIQKLEGQEVQLDQVCPVNIVSGADPEWTGYLLQCTAVAAWSGKPADPEDGAAEAAPEAETAAPAEEEAPRPTTAAPRLSAEEIAQREAELAQREAEATAAAAAAVAAAEAAANAPDVLAPLEVPVYESPQFDEEKLKEMADGMDFAQAMAAFTGVVGSLEADAQPGGLVRQDSVDSKDSADWQPPEGLPASSETAGRMGTTGQVPLQNAAARAAKVSAEIQRAQDLLDQMDEALENDDAILQKQRERGAEMRAAKDAEKQAEIDRLTAEEEAEAEKVRAKADAKAKRRAERDAAKERLEELKKLAEEEAAGLAAQAAFPRSKLSQTQAARMVANYGVEEKEEEEEEEEYEWDGDDAPDGEGDGAAEEDAAPADGEAGEAAGDPADPMAACFTDAILGAAAPVEEKPLFPTGTPPPEPSASELALPATGHPPLFDRLKAELKDQFIPFLSASMPSSLLKKYEANDLVAALQFLLQELRKCVAAHNLEDVQDEEPTELAEILRQNFPNDWLAHLQGGSAWALTAKYDLPELVDTLQGLAQVCSERLSDELGIVAMWCDEESPLRSPIALISPSWNEEPPPNVEEDPPCEDDDPPRPGTAAAAPAPWAEPAVAAPTEPARLGTAAGFAGTSAGFAGTSAGFARSPPPPVFSADLGLAPWEREEMGMPTTAGPRTAAPRVATGMISRGGGPRPPMTASRGAGFTSAGR